MTSDKKFGCHYKCKKGNASEFDKMLTTMIKDIKYYDLTIFDVTFSAYESSDTYYLAWFSK